MSDADREEGVVGSDGPDGLAPDGAAGDPVHPIDWESFYANYRKPGYIDGFEITSKLGGGMFGLVFKAVRQSIGKDYAIKFLKVDDQDVRQAVLNELDSVRYFAQVDHPNLVSIEDRGVVDGIPYIVMAYAGSDTLRQRLEDPQVDRRALLHLFLQACRGVHALHERSLVHFDLKPANIFIKGDVARVGDYGLSKLVSASRNSLSMGRGTPYYMAPEMLHRRGDHRSDIYSLGVMLFECLTGEVPFKGDSEWEVLKAHETQDPTFPDHVAPEHRGVVLRCMAKAPEERYATVAEIIEDLRAPTSAAAAAVADLGVAAGGLDRPEPPPLPSGAPRPEPPPLPSPGAPRRVVVPPPIPEAYARRKVGAKEVVASIGSSAPGPDADPAAIALAAAQNARRVGAGSGRRRTRRTKAAAANASRGGRRGGRGALVAIGIAGLLFLGFVVITWVGVRQVGDRREWAMQEFDSRARMAVQLQSEAQAEQILQRLVTRPLAEAATTIVQSPSGAHFESGPAVLGAGGPTGHQAALPDRWLKTMPPVEFPFGTTLRERGQIREAVENLAIRSEYRTGLGRPVQDFGFAGFIGTVDFLQNLNMEDPRDVEQARRVVEFLRDWTGVGSIEIRPAGKGRPVPEDLTYNLKGICAWRSILDRYCQSAEQFEAFVEARTVPGAAGGTGAGAGSASGPRDARARTRVPAPSSRVRDR